MTYRYDALLNAHFKYASLVGNAAKFGLGYATGIPIGGAGTAGMVTGIAKDITATAATPNTGPTVMGQGVPGKDPSKLKLSSLREKGASFQFKGAEEGLGHRLMHGAIHYGPYAAWMASHAIEDKHPELARALGMGAAATLGGAVAHDLYKNPGQRRAENYMDLAGLALFGGGDLLRYLKQRRA